MTDASTIDQLRAVPIFRHLGDAELQHLAGVATPFEVEPGHVLAEPHHAGSGMFVITEGSVDVELPGGGTVSLGPGEFVGELAVLADMDRVARVRSASSVRGFAIARAAFGDLLEQHPRIAVAMLPVLAKRLAELEAGLGS
jgi:CRP-like cAMP-binding protein